MTAYFLQQVNTVMIIRSQVWKKMQQKLNIKVKDWNLDNGPAVLICCQRDGGWSMDKQEVVPG